MWSTLLVKAAWLSPRNVANAAINSAIKFRRAPKLEMKAPKHLLPEEALQWEVNRSPVIKPFRAVQSLGKMMESIPPGPPALNAVRDQILKERQLFERLLLGK